VRRDLVACRKCRLKLILRRILEREAHLYVLAYVHVASFAIIVLASQSREYEAGWGGGHCRSQLH
jgi:hypothetical protein